MFSCSVTRMWVRKLCQHCKRCSQLAVYCEIWITMQTTEEAGLAFWLGEIEHERPPASKWVLLWLIEIPLKWLNHFMFLCSLCFYLAPMARHSCSTASGWERCKYNKESITVIASFSWNTEKNCDRKAAIQRRIRPPFCAWTNLRYPDASRVTTALALVSRVTGVRRIRGGWMVIQGRWWVTVMDSSL